MQNFEMRYLLKINRVMVVAYLEAMRNIKPSQQIGGADKMKSPLPRIVCCSRSSRPGASI